MLEVKRPRNNHVLARFDIWVDFRYRLTAEHEIRMGIEYAWCVHCESFVEIEKLWSEADIVSNSENLLLVGGTGVNDQGFVNSRRNNAFEWLRNRTVLPRCLSCESLASTTRIPYGVEMSHPGGIGTIILIADGTLGGGPSCNSPEYFSPDGRRIATHPSRGSSVSDE